RTARVGAPEAGARRGGRRPDPPPPRRSGAARQAAHPGDRHADRQEQRRARSPPGEPRRRQARSRVMPRSLEPTQVVLPAQLARGLLIGLPNPGAKDASGQPDTRYETLRFQYNPETVTRTRSGQWERKLDKKTS